MARAEYGKFWIATGKCLRCNCLKNKDRIVKRTSICKDCKNIQNKKYVNKVQDKETRKQWYTRNPNYNREYNLAKHGITQEEYNNLLCSQNYKCAICEKHESIFNIKFAIDHNHLCCPGKFSCGKCIRGLLCTGCNTALGLFGDDLPLLQKALYYVQKDQKMIQ